MITKQETFKKILSDDFHRWDDLDEDMQMHMCVIFKWSLTLHPNIAMEDHIAYKTVNGEWYAKVVYEDGPEWRQDVSSCLKKLGRV